MSGRDENRWKSDIDCSCGDELHYWQVHDKIRFIFAYLNPDAYCRLGGKAPIVFRRIIADSYDSMIFRNVNRFIDEIGYLKCNECGCRIGGDSREFLTRFIRFILSNWDNRFFKGGMSKYGKG